MATYIKDLVEDNGDITRPVTEAGAVLLSGGGDLETTLASKADQTTVDGKINIGDVQGTDLSANAKLAILNMIYPVGSIFMSATFSTATQVASAMGGTWVAWGSGRVPVGVNSSDSDFNTVEKTGGSKYLQQHSHNTVNWAAGYTTGSQSGYFNVLCGTSSSNTKKAVADAGTGDSGNLQPYITCYMYKRTA